jgi:hypothetical protein
MPKQELVPFSIGEKILIRTVTHYQIGEVVAVKDVGSTTFVFLKNASWVADMKRFADTLKDGFPSDAEIEPAPGIVGVNVGAIVDFFEWNHDLPTKQQ